METDRFCRVFSNSAEMYFIGVLYMISIFLTFMKKKVGFLEGETENSSVRLFGLLHTSLYNIVTMFLQLVFSAVILVFG